MNNSDRQTGRTTKQLQDCLAIAATGKTVVFVTPNPYFSRHYAIPLIRGPLESFAHWRIDLNRCEVIFDNGGRLTFTDASADPVRVLGGLRVALAFDHAWNANGDVHPGWRDAAFDKNPSVEYVVGRP